MNSKAQIDVEPMRKGSSRWKVLLGWEAHPSRELVRDGMTAVPARLVGNVCRRALENKERWISSVIEQGEK
ncbi:MAG: hypothetical protein ACREP9_14285 [Candidatus Dormibacteraceae bacterium]